ncbi:flagellar basal body protein FliL [Roseovarius sp. A21]|uniref:Flagellar protein FliL n=1 Tax=Roseovarius bejariae TaxID=2576383 RepID=A0A844CWD6_9RHOB|nr:flagellar basal body-associated FliL family protein [Roseovarius bejariae]MRU15466.1 flagellar basal body protein FliL [Roseovarius bejariae]
MAETENTEEETPKKASKLPLIIGLVLALLGGGGGFFAVYSGLILAPDEDKHVAGEESPEKVKDMPDVAFVPVDPMVISLNSGRARHLRFQAQLEVGTPHKAEVTKLMPRVVDVLNSYLRALEPEDLEAGAALIRLRAQMLRRVQIVTGGDRVKDLLIMEFVLN